MEQIKGVNPEAPASGAGCLECEESGGWWLHLRRCAECGHVGCCDNSPGRHATAHATATAHPLIRSFEPGEAWFWSYQEEQFYESGPALAPPESHPLDQSTPGPGDRVPHDWQSQLNE